MTRAELEFKLRLAGLWQHEGSIDEDDPVWFEQPVLLLKALFCWLETEPPNISSCGGRYRTSAAALKELEALYVDLVEVLGHHRTTVERFAEQEVQPYRDSQRRRRGTAPEREAKKLAKRYAAFFEDAE